MFIPNTTNNTVYIAEHSEHKFDFTIRGAASIVLQWCLDGPDKQRYCCICSDDENCQVKDWTVTKYSNECTYYTCLLTIHNISMNYSDVTLISRATSDDDRRIVNYTRISIIQDTDDHKSLPSLVLYGIVIGVGVGVMVIITMICVVYMIKRRSHSRYLQLMSHEEQFSTSGKQINTIIRITNESIEFVNFTFTYKYFSNYDDSTL